MEAFFIFPHNGTPSAQPPHQSKVLGRGEGEPFSRKVPLPPSNLFYFTNFLNHEIGCMDGSFV